MLFYLRFFCKKPAKIEVEGLPNLLQNPSQSDPKAISQKHVHFCCFWIDVHLSFKPSKPGKYQFSLSKINIFQVFAIIVFQPFGQCLAFKNYPKNHQKPPPNHEKIESENDLFLSIIFFEFLDSFWQLLGGSWASLGKLWASKMVSKRVSDIEGSLFFLNFSHFRCCNSILLQF